MAVTILCGLEPVRRSDPDIYVDSDSNSREILGVPIRIRETLVSSNEGIGVPQYLRSYESETGDSDISETGDSDTSESEEDFEGIKDINLDDLANDNNDLFRETPLTVTEGHEKLRHVLLFYFHGRNYAPKHFLAYKHLASYLESMPPLHAQKILEIAVEHGWSDLTLELVRLFERRSLVLPAGTKLLKKALLSGQFQVSLQMLRQPILRKCFIDSGEKIMASDFSETRIDEYAFFNLEAILIEIMDIGLMDDAESISVGHRISRERVYTDETPEEPQVTKTDETVTANPASKLEKLSHSWGSSTIGTIVQAATRKTRSLFDKGYKDRMGEARVSRRSSIKDSEDDVINGNK